MAQTMLLDTVSCSRSRVQTLLDIAEKRGYFLELVNGYAEPDYGDKPVVLGDWNDRRDREGKVTDNTMPRLAVLFEKLGYEFEWEDEWVVCPECFRAARTRGDSYSWRQYYWMNPVNCELLCGDCIKNDPTEYLEYLNGNVKDCDTIGIDLAKHGYRLYSGNHISGWNPGQDADPAEIAEQLAKEGITDIIFQLDIVAQFGLRFSVWQKNTLGGGGK